MIRQDYGFMCELSIKDGSHLDSAGIMWLNLHTSLSHMIAIVVGKCVAIDNWNADYPTCFLFLLFSLCIYIYVYYIFIKYK